MSPTWTSGSRLLGLGDAEQALNWYRKGQALETSVRACDALIVRALAALDRADEGEEIMHRLEEEARQSYVRADVLAMGYAALGDADSAFASLSRAYETRSASLIYLHLDPGYAPLRATRRGVPAQCGRRNPGCHDRSLSVTADAAWNASPRVADA